jgi:hypothetical protein
MRNTKIGVTLMVALSALVLTTATWLAMKG